GSNDYAVRLWDLETGRCLLVLKGHASVVRSVAWNANEKFILASDNDGAVRLWDLENGLCLCVLEGHTSEVNSVAWSADQCRAFSGETSGDIRIWDLSEFVIEEVTSKIVVPALQAVLDQVQYTNAKVLLVGESGAGKTGLTERLAHDTFTPSYSTS